MIQIIGYNLELNSKICTNDNIPCLNLMSLEKGALVNHQNTSEQQLSKNIKANKQGVYLLILLNFNYQKIFRDMNHNRKRELAFAKKIYYHKTLNSENALKLLSEYRYQKMHSQFYKSFPSPELPIGLVKLLIKNNLLRLTAYYFEGNIVGIILSKLIGFEYCIMFVIYDKKQIPLKGISTFMWNHQIEMAIEEKAAYINLGTSLIHSGAAKFKESLGSHYYSDATLQHKTDQSNLKKIIINASDSKPIKLFFSILPDSIYKAMGYLAYKLFGGYV